jgi:hypothetical protein
MPLIPRASAIGLLMILALGVTDGRAQTDLAFFEKALQFAKSSDGLNLFPTEAQKFAERFAALPDAPRALQVYQDSFNFAKSNTGLNIFPTEAMKFADRFALRRDGAKLLVSYQEAFKFATKSDGLNLFPTEAMKFAEKKSGLLEPEKIADPRPSGVAKIHPGRVEAIKILADLSRSLKDRQNEVDALIDLASTAKTDAERVALDNKLARLGDQLKATVAEIEKVSLAPAPTSPKPR